MAGKHVCVALKILIFKWNGKCFQVFQSLIILSFKFFFVISMYGSNNKLDLFWHRGTNILSVEIHRVYEWKSFLSHWNLSVIVELNILFWMYHLTQDLNSRNKIHYGILYNDTINKNQFEHENILSMKPLNCIYLLKKGIIFLTWQFFFYIEVFY